MPVVRLTFEDGTSWRDAGGCFGFAGRHRRCSSNLSVATKFTYLLYRDTSLPSEYHESSAWYLTWLMGSSPWAKYFLDSPTVSSRDLTSNSFGVDIDPNNLGHAVIGCASLVRLVAHKPYLLSVVKQLADEGCDPTLSFLIAYTYLGGTYRTAPSVRDSYQPSGSLGLGDDEPLTTHRLSCGEVYSMLSGNFEFKGNDNDPMYKDTLRYNQDILNSYKIVEERLGFARYLKMRTLNIFAHSPAYPKVSTGMGGLGRSNVRRYRGSIEAITPGNLNVFEIKGLAHTLSKELNAYGKLLGFGSEGDFVL